MLEALVGTARSNHSEQVEDIQYTPKTSPRETACSHLKPLAPGVLRREYGHGLVGTPGARRQGVLTPHTVLTLNAHARIPTVWMRLLNSIVGFDRIKHRGDRYFLDGDFHCAKREYERARSTLAQVDYRIVTMDALIRECSVRTGEPVDRIEEGPSAGSPSPSVSGASEEADRPFVPDMNDLLELAIAGKPAERAAIYRGLGSEFEAGYVALVQGNPTRAVELLGLAGRKLPSTLVLHLELARALSMTGDMNGARLELEKARNVSPSDLEVSNLQGAVLNQLGMFEEAGTVLLPLLDRKDAGAESFFLVGQSLAGQGRRSEALGRFREAVERDGGFPDAYFEAGRLLRKDGDDAGALRLLKQACSLLPDELDYNRELATLVIERELNVDAGLAACDRLMVTDEENRWEYLSWIAELYLRNGWRREAADPLRKAIALVPSDLPEEKRELQKRLAGLEGLPSGA